MMIKPGQIYRHSKSGKLYKLIALALHSETNEELVVYETLYENELSKIWVRPKNMFTEMVEIEGEQKPRFELVEAD